MSWGIDRQIDEMLRKCAEVSGRTDVRPGESPFVAMGLHKAGVWEPEERLCFRSEYGQPEGEPDYEWDRQPAMSFDMFEEACRMVRCMVGAMNNFTGYGKFLSYSKALCVPLFKYCDPGSVLTGETLTLNTMKVWAVAGYDVRTCDGMYRVDEFGRKVGTHRAKAVECTVPFRALTSRETLADEIRRALRRELSDLTDENGEPMYDVTNATVNWYTGFTADVSALKRKDELLPFLDKMIERIRRNPYKYRSTRVSSLKLMASYRKDREVISTVRPASLRVDGQDTLDFLRFLYVLCAFNSPANCEALWDAYASGRLGLRPDERSAQSLERIYREYLVKNSWYEYDALTDLYREPSYWCFNRYLPDAARALHRICEKTFFRVPKDKEPRVVCFQNKELYRAMAEISLGKYAETALTGREVD